MNFWESQLVKETVEFKDEVRPLLPQYKWLVAGFSDRRHGNMRITVNGDPVDSLARARFATEMGVPGDRVVRPVLVHDAKAEVVTEKHLEDRFEADALVTNQPNLFLSVTNADCLPVFLVDVKKKIIGLAHVGWRGMLRGVIEETILTMKKLGADPTLMRVAIGPSIGPCHYDVRLSLAQQFEEKLGADVLTKRDDRIFLDLKKSASRLLGRAGIQPTNVKISPVCNQCEERFFSHRRDSTQGVESMVAIFGMTE